MNALGFLESGPSSSAMVLGRGGLFGGAGRRAAAKFGGAGRRAAAEPVDPAKLLERMRMLRMGMEASVERMRGRRVSGLM